MCVSSSIRGRLLYADTTGFCGDCVNKNLLLRFVCCCCCCCCARFWLLQSLKDPIVASILGIHFIPRCKMVSLGAVLTLVSHVVVHSALAVKAKQHPPDRPDRAERAFDGRGGGQRPFALPQAASKDGSTHISNSMHPAAGPTEVFFFFGVVGRFTPMVL